LATGIPPGVDGGVYLLRVILDPRGSYTPDILGIYQVSTLRILSETTRFLHSGCFRRLLGFYTPDTLGDYEISTLRMFSEFTKFLHSGYSRRLLGFYTPDTLGHY